MARFWHIVSRVAAVWLSLAPLLVDANTVKGKSFPTLIEATIDDLNSGLSSGLFTSVDLVNAYTARIKEVNGTLHMVTELNPDALTIAATADALRKNGTILGPLHGIPVIIKNNIGTLDKMNTTAGSYALLGAKLPSDSTIAAKLRKAGAIILGKSNLSQWANFRSDNTSNGWSAYGGQTYAAYFPNQDPSGSSSGSGVSSSIGLAAVSIGTETDGSIISPSDVNNLAGIKPSVGLTSRYLVIPISEHQDTIGPMARTVKDAAYVLNAIAGPDLNDNYTSAIPNCGKIPDYVAACNANALAGARIGIPYNVYDSSDSAVNAAFISAVSVIEGAGATVVAANFTDPTGGTNETVLFADFINDLANYLAKLTYNPNNVHSLADVRNFTQHFGPEDYPDRDTNVWNDALALGFNNTDYRFWEAYQMQLYAGGDGGLLGALSRNNLDALILPSQQSPDLAAGVGAPIVTVPMGFYPANTTVVTTKRGLVETAPNIPFGLSFLGARFTEEKLVGFAYAFEQKTKIRDDVQPYIVPNYEIGAFAGY